MEINTADEARRRTEEQMDAAAGPPRDLMPVLDEEAQLQLIAMYRSQQGAGKTSVLLVARPASALRPRPAPGVGTGQSPWDGGSV